MSEYEGKYGHPRFYEILEKMAALHSRKNHDYSGTDDPLKNLHAVEKIGITPFMGVLVRLQDKWSRLEQFANSGTMLVKDESVIDTLMDNAVYSLLAIILLEEEKAKTKPDYRAMRYCSECVKNLEAAGPGDGVKICPDCDYILGEPDVKKEN